MTTHSPSNPLARTTGTDTDVMLETRPEPLSDGSCVFNVWLRAYGTQIHFPACSEADALALQGGLIDLLVKHTVCNVQER